jgi:hypothetical protein
MGRWRLAHEKALERLVKALDLATGLRVVRSGVLGDDAQAVEFGFEHDPTLAGYATEDGSVVGEKGGWQSELTGGAEEGCHGVCGLDGAEGNRCDKQA